MHKAHAKQNHTIDIIKGGDYFTTVSIFETKVTLSSIIDVDIDSEIIFQKDDEASTYQLDIPSQESVQVNNADVQLPYLMQPDDSISLSDDIEIVYKLSDDVESETRDAINTISASVDDAISEPTQMTDSKPDTITNSDAFELLDTSETIEDITSETEPTSISQDTEESVVDWLVQSDDEQIEPEPTEVPPKQIEQQVGIGHKQNMLQRLAETVPDDSWAVVEPKEPVKAKTDENAPYRPGCGFCFETLDPQDTDPKLQTFVTHNGRYYHQSCWQQNKPKAASEGEIVTVATPKPLEVVTRTPVLLYGGPINTLRDTPLGISKGTVSIDSRASDATQQGIILRNNIDVPVEVNRTIQPVWGYLDYGNYREVSNTVTLTPNQQQQVTIYPHPAHPNWHQTKLDITDTQTILMVADKRSIPFSISIVFLFFLSLTHIVLGWQWIWDATPYNTRTIIEHLMLSLTTGLFVGWLVFMMPAKLLWYVFDAMGFLMNARFIKDITPLTSNLEKAREFIWTLFAEHKVADWYEKPSQLLIGAGVATLIGTLFGMLLWILFGGIASGFGVLGDPTSYDYGALWFFSLLLMSLIFVGIVYGLIGVIMESYGIQLNQATSRFARSVIRSINRRAQESLNTNTES